MNKNNKKFRHLDLFSGIGGFALAASWVWGEQHEIVSFCEIESFPQKVLKKHWPDVPIHDDIKTMKGDQYGRIDILTGGFPCQPYSVAGKQRGSEDDRALWPEMFRIIKEAKPNWVIGENVAGFINMGLDDSLFDLESQGYETTAFIIPACGTSANHKRERIWILAANTKRLRSPKQRGKHQWPEIITRSCQNKMATGSNVVNSNKIKLQDSNIKHGISQKKNKHGTPLSGCSCGKEHFAIEPGVDRVANGIPNRVDRIKGLGNAIVPQVVVPIMESIKQIEEAN